MILTPSERFPRAPHRDAPILLAHSYFLRHDPKQVAKMKPYAPLGTLLAAGVLRARGFEVRLFDAMVADGVDDFVRMVSEVRPGIVGIFEDNFNFLTKMCTVRMREAAHEMIRAAKAGGARVAVNGSDANDRPALYLEAGADAVIAGEVEDTALELFELWRRDPDAPLGGVNGLVLRSGDGPSGAGAVKADDANLVRTRVRATIAELNDRPLPAWDLVDVGRYRDAWTAAHGRLSWSMVTSRGCPYGCNWCAKPVFGRRYTQRGPADVARELLLLKREVAPGHVWFADDIFGLTAEWIEIFADEVERLDAAIPFLIQSRANLLTPRATDALRRAGCEEVWLGVESGSQRILDAMDKGSRLDEIRAATRNLRERSIRSGWFLQLGFLGEDWDDILRTRDLVREARPDDVGVSVSYPLPGTRFFELVREGLGPRTNWMDSDELAMLFQGTYVTDFYRQVRELLHAEVREGEALPEESLDERWAELEAVEARYRVLATSLNG
jgi:anaerobic magnesium-protoporphyrin IX monomethyl ester cyclase